MMPPQDGEFQSSLGVGAGLEGNQLASLEQPKLEDIVLVPEDTTAYICTPESYEEP
jgi:hypothetical protein